MKKVKRERSVIAGKKKETLSVPRRANDLRITEGLGHRLKKTTKVSNIQSPRLIPQSGERTIYRSAFNLAKKNGTDEQVAKLLWSGHSSGDGRATYALATWYLHGVFYGKDPTKAARLLKIAVKKTVREAMFDLAVSYETGYGVEKSIAKAFDLYLAAATAGDESAIEEVVRCIYWGLGTARNKKLALLVRQLRSCVDLTPRLSGS